jgi:uncharacterized ParB-like nuclease family protein
MPGDIQEVKNTDVIYYTTDESNFKFPVFFKDDTFWTTQKVMGRLFDVNVPAISKHLDNIYDEGELNRESTVSKKEIVQNEGGRTIKRVVDFYNLDAIIAVGYRVNSKSATRFRQWATATLHDFVMTNLAKSNGFQNMTEEQKRTTIRNELTEHNKSLAEAAKMAGVVEPLDYAIFQNEGYKGLYGGLGQKEIHQRKGLKKSQKILDFMGSTELAANLFRATQADEKIRRENVSGKAEANRAHHEVGKKVRATIKELGGTMPENLPTPERSIKQLESEQKKIETRNDGDADE